ncbi:hypothetical protein ACX0HA_06470 [Flavobacterium hauense]
MKYAIYLLVLLPFISFCQNDYNASVVSIEKANTVYRNVENYIKIGVPNAKSFEVSSTGTLKKLDEFGNYSLIVTQVPGLEFDIKIDITLNDGTKKKEYKKFYIKNLGSAYGTIDGKGGIDCIVKANINELKNAIIGFKFENFIYEIQGLDGHFGSKFDGIVRKFTVGIISKNGKKIIKEIEIIGNQFDKKILDELEKMDSGREFLIYHIIANGFDKSPRDIHILIE